MKRAMRTTTVNHINRELAEEVKQEIAAIHAALQVAADAEAARER